MNRASSLIRSIHLPAPKPKHASVSLSRSVLAYIDKAIQLVDAVHEIEAADNRRDRLPRPFDTRFSLAASPYIKRLAYCLEDIAACLTDAASVRSLQLRAQILRGQETEAAYAALYQLHESQLLALAGDLGTWYRKPVRSLFSAFFAVPVHSYQDLADHAQQLKPELLRDLRHRFHSELNISPAPQFVVTRQIACAGEAAMFPRHFAYFLPEDEGRRQVAHKRTVMFISRYASIYENISAPLLRRFTRGVQDNSSAGQDISRYLMLWFRGHDMAHGMKLPSTYYPALRVEGKWLSMQVQEAIADVFGFLFLVRDPWKSAFGLDEETAVSVFLGEMLRYLRRGPREFPDSGAAFLELNYLQKNGYLKASNKNFLHIDTTAFVQGMHALGEELVAAVLTGTSDVFCRFVGQYSAEKDRQSLEDSQWLWRV